MTASRDLALYLHWPFCLSKCPYCDFNSHVRAAVDQGRWRRALLAELAHWAAETPGRQLTSIFFGGGTPSLMAPDSVAALIAAARSHWAAAPDLEVTLEANPTSVEGARFAAYAEAGVNRLSLGIQSLDDTALAFLGRRHSAAEARAALAIARRHFARVSFDLIYARPGQTWDSWKRELEMALAEGPDHISLYQLTIEENTPFHGARRRGELVELAEETAVTLFQETRARLAAAGLPAYEISNHAAAGRESRHNLTYWRSGDYAGVGPGAHGRLSLAEGKVATRQHRAPEAWLAAVEKAGHATRGRELLTARQRRDEAVMMGLRLTEGLSRRDLEAALGETVEALFEAERLAALRKEGLLVIDDDGLRASEAGLQRLNAVIGYLLG